MRSTAYLESLLAIAGKKNRKTTDGAINALKDLFLTVLLPNKTQLRSFTQMLRLSPGKPTAEQTHEMYVEHTCKQAY